MQINGKEIEVMTSYHMATGNTTANKISFSWQVNGEWVFAEASDEDYQEMMEALKKRTIKQYYREHNCVFCKHRKFCGFNYEAHDKCMRTVGAIIDNPEEIQPWCPGREATEEGEGDELF